MCGICGIINLNGEPVKARTLNKMLQTLHHRGPDNSASYKARNVGLGHARLSIRDLSKHGNQPFKIAGGNIVVVYNGELYNSDLIKTKIIEKIGDVFRGSSDTEVFSWAYFIWGDAIFPKLEGMFAAAIWDTRTNELTLVRDHLGIKPLYIHRTPERIIFASEIKAILEHPNVEKKFNYDGLGNFFRYGYSGLPNSTVENISPLSPGHYVKVHNNKLGQEKKFFSFNFSKEIKDIDEASENFSIIFDEVIKDTLVSDLPIGVLQSGGIDSSLISASASKFQKLHLYTVDFDNKNFSERADAIKIVRALGLEENHKILGQENETSVSLLNRAILAMEGQNCDEAALPLLSVMDKIKNNATVILSGDGADELFGGYATYKASFFSHALHRLFPNAASGYLGKKLYGASLGSSSRFSYQTILSRFFLSLQNSSATASTDFRRRIPFHIGSTIFDGDFLDYWMSTNQTDYQKFYSSACGFDGREKARFADLNFHLPHGMLHKADTISMTNSIELRVPFLHPKIVEFATKCDIPLLMPLLGNTKPLLRRALSNFGIDRSVINQNKRGFNSPISENLRTHFFHIAEKLFSSDLEIFEPIFKPDKVSEIWTQHKEFKVNHDYVLWSMLNFGIWRRLSNF